MAINLSLAGAGVLQAVIYLLFVRAVDLYERESFKYVIPVFVWGFSVAVVFSLFFNTLSSFTLSEVASLQPSVVSFVTAVFVAPPVEEFWKGLAVLIVFLISFAVHYRRGVIEFAGVMDGIVYGSAVGFGFAIVEDLLYYAQAGPETFVVRRLFGGFAHAAFTSLTGIGIGLIPWVRSRILKVLLPVAGLAGAIALHAAFNFTASLFGALAYVILFFVLLMYVAIIVSWLAVERRVIRSELRDEVGGAINAYEYEIIPTYFRRTLYYLRLFFTLHLIRWRRARRVHAAAIDLAFTKRLSRISYAAPQEFRLQYLRRRIGEHRGSPTSVYEPW
ncbi:MAG: PrsW family intramembrane metalloprotease [Rubrobacter sp.]|nr:PrsW family intramembrane metalloprotease [Rubrobacter sp.]